MGIPMTQHRTFKRAFLMTATLVAGTLANSCQMTWRDSLVGATKNTFLTATGEVLTSLFDSAALGLGISLSAGT